MDILGWLWWGVAKIAGLAWSFAWFLLGGWVSTLLQLVILIGAVFAMKYGWRQAPQEMWNRVRPLGRFAWNWARAREVTAPAASQRAEVREAVRVVRVKEPGDMSASTVLTVAMLAGIVLAVAARAN